MFNLPVNDQRPADQIPIFARAGGGAGGWFRSMTFQLPLLTSIVTARAVGSGTPTYTRATAATVTDWENVVRPVLSGEVRFQGARRVQNVLTGSNNFSSPAAWSIAAGAVTFTNNVAAPDGTLTATRLAVTADLTFRGGSSVAKGTTAARGAVWMRLVVGTPIPSDIEMDINDGFFVNLGTQVTSTWQRFATPGGVPGASLTTYFLDIFIKAGLTVELWQAQLEDQAGQSNTNPSEYVSVGVLAAPYQGAGVDGVQYFSTQNGNTVASNVVTAGTGAAIGSITLLGYLTEGARTNLCLQSEDFATTWTVTANSSITTNTTIAPDGNTTADTLNEDATAAVAHPVIQGFTKAASALTYSFSVYIKPAGRTWAAITLWDGASVGSRYWFNLSGAGTVGSTAAIGVGFTALSASIQALPNGWYRCIFNATSNAVAALQINIHSTDADASLTPAAGLNGAGLRLWGAQLEQAAFASSYIPTTTVAVTRNADVLTYPSAGNVSDSAGSAYAEVNEPTAVATSRLISGATANIAALYQQSSTNKLGIFDGTIEIVSAAAVASGTSYKGASSWGTGRSVSLNGAIVTGAFDGSMNFGASLGIGFDNSGAANSALFGTIRNVRIFSRQLPDSVLQSMTT